MLQTILALCIALCLLLSAFYVLFVDDWSADFLLKERKELISDAKPFA